MCAYIILGIRDEIFGLTDEEEKPNDESAVSTAQRIGRKGVREKGR